MTNAFYLDVPIHNVSLFLFTYAYNEAQSEAWYQFEGLLFYKITGEKILQRSKVWSEQGFALTDTKALQRSFDDNPTLASEHVKLVDVTILNTYIGKDQELKGGAEPNATTLQVAIVAAFLVAFISILAGLVVVASRAKFLARFRGRRGIDETATQSQIKSSSTHHTNRSPPSSDASDTDAYVFSSVMQTADHESSSFLRGLPRLEEKSINLSHFPIPEEECEVDDASVPLSIHGIDSADYSAKYGDSDGAGSEISSMTGTRNGDCQRLTI